MSLKATTPNPEPTRLRNLYGHRHVSVRVFPELVNRSDVHLASMKAHVAMPQIHQLGEKLVLLFDRLQIQHPTYPIRKFAQTEVEKHRIPPIRFLATRVQRRLAIFKPQVKLWPPYKLLQIIKILRIQADTELAVAKVEHLDQKVRSGERLHDRKTLPCRNGHAVHHESKVLR